MKKKHMVISEFYCTCCGNKGIPLARNKGNLKNCGHLKKLYCWHCKKLVNHVEVKPKSNYFYEDFFKEFDLGRYVDGQIIPIAQLKPCSKDCKCNVNGKCWNSNGKNKCEVLENEHS